MSDELTTWGRRAWAALEAVHVPAYFSPESREEYKAIGLRPALAYFPVRAAAMGAVPAEVVEATFYVFAPSVVRLVVPECWDSVTPERVLDARHRSVSRTLHRLLDPVVESVGPDVLDDAVDLARRACEGLVAPGRPLYAGHASLSWPDDPLMRLWHAATLVREHRGDGHVAALVTYGLGPLEAMVTSLLAGSVVTESFLRRSRGWTDAQWDAARGALAERGLVERAVETTVENAVDGSGGSWRLTDAGRDLRAAVETATDRGVQSAWQHLGLEGTRRLASLLRPFSAAVTESGALAAARVG